MCFAHVHPADTSARAGLRTPCLSKPMCCPRVDIIDLPRQALWSGHLRGIFVPEEDRGSLSPGGMDHLGILKNLVRVPELGVSHGVGGLIPLV